jgi:hypothetical protein
MQSGDGMGSRIKRFNIGRYGSGTLSVLKNSEGQFILFNATRIAQRRPGMRTWVGLERGWRVTPEGSLTVRVCLNDSEGVIVALDRAGEGN